MLATSPIPEASPTKENPQPESISEMCQQLTQGLATMTATEESTPPRSAPPSQTQFNRADSPARQQQQQQQQQHQTVQASCKYICLVHSKCVTFS